MEPAHVTSCADGEEALKAARALLRPGDVALVKASRVVGLERVALALSEDAG